MNYKNDVTEWLKLHTRQEKRFSDTLVEQLSVHMEARTLNVFSVYDVVALLEGRPNRAYPTKKEDKFKYPPLKGLWKKHVFQASYMLKNLQLLRDTEPVKLSIRTVGDINKNIDFAIADYLVDKNFCKRASKSALTGEWLVFAKYKEKNYYLTLGEHGHDDIVRLNVDKCVDEFPFLSTILSENN